MSQSIEAKAACWDLIVAYCTDPDDDAADLFNIVMGWSNSLDTEDPAGVQAEATRAIGEFSHVKTQGNDEQQR